MQECLGIVSEFYDVPRYFILTCLIDLFGNLKCAADKEPFDTGQADDLRRHLSEQNTEVPPQSQDIPLIDSEIMVETIACWYLQGSHQKPGFLNGRVTWISSMNSMKYWFIVIRHRRSSLPRCSRSIKPANATRRPQGQALARNSILELPVARGLIKRSFALGENPTKLMIWVWLKIRELGLRRL